MKTAQRVLLSCRIDIKQLPLRESWNVLLRLYAQPVQVSQSDGGLPTANVCIWYVEPQARASCLPVLPGTISITN